MSKSVLLKKIHTWLGLKEWSDRDPDIEWYQIGGLHYINDPKVQVDHKTQQRFYAAAHHFTSAEKGYTESVNEILDRCKMATLIERDHPDLFKRYAAVVGLIHSQLEIQSKDVAAEVLAAFPGSKVIA